MAEFVLAPRAKQDMRLIGQFTQERWGRAQRDAYLDRLVEAFTTIAAEPALGKSRHEIKQGLLSYLCARHVIYFRQGCTSIEILRILHQRMDAVAHL